MKKFLFVFLSLAAAAECTVASIKGIGMGGACVSYPLDSGVIAYNPAGIVDLCNRVDANLYGVCNLGSTKVEGNLDPLLNRTDGNTFRWVFSPEVGSVYHFTPTIAAGFLVYNEKSLQVKYSRNFPLLGKTPVGLEYILEVLAPTVSVKLFGHHAFSVTLNYMVQRFREKGLENLRLLSASPDFVTNKGYNYSNGIGVTLGYLGDFFHDTVRVGFAWRSLAPMNKLSDYKGFIADRGTFNIPQVFRAGISATPFCAWTFAFDYELICYSQIPSLHNNFSLFSGAPLGGQGGSGFGWKDQSFYRFGVNYDFSRCLAFRAGFRHATECFKGKNVAPNLLTLDTTVDFVTTGLTWLITKNLEINGLFAYGFNRKVQGPLPIEFEGGTIKLQQETFVGALGMGWYY